MRFQTRIDTNNINDEDLQAFLLEREIRWQIFGDLGPAGKVVEYSSEQRRPLEDLLVTFFFSGDEQFDKSLIDSITALDFKKPITNIDEAKQFIKGLHDADLLFHFEDRPEEIIRDIDGSGRLFTDEEAADLCERVKELYSLDWSKVGHECPIGYALEVVGAGIDTTLSLRSCKFSLTPSAWKKPPAKPSSSM